MANSDQVTGSLEAAAGHGSRRSLRQLAVSSGIWTIAGFSAEHGLRLVSNLVLTRLLFPEAFGLMALVNVVRQGLELLSDMGITASVIRSDRGDEPHFLNTAWTLQIVRGFVLWVVTYLLAWPIAQIYDEPILMKLLPVAAATSVILGFRSTNFVTAQRHLALGRRTLLELGSQVGNVLVTIALAWWTRSVWALVLGGLVGPVLVAMLSHRVLPGVKNRIQWDEAAWREMVHFGKWILVATLATYFCGQGLRLLQGLLVDTETLGLIYIAGMLAGSIGQLINNLGQKVLFPTYAQIWQTRPEDLSSTIFRARVWLLGLCLPAFSTLILFGPEVIELLYDSRYQRAGICTSLIAVNGAVASITLPYGIALLAFGDSKKHAVIQTVNAGLRVVGACVGFYIAGVIGMLGALATTGLVIYPLRAMVARQYGVWHGRFDLAAGLMVGAISLVGITLQLV